MGVHCLLFYVATSPAFVMFGIATRHLNPHQQGDLTLTLMVTCLAHALHIE